jgi:glucose-6-phosphate 1-dehydrogenase
MRQHIDTLVILGAGGDLASRLLLPGLASFLAHHSGGELAVIGVGRDARTDAQWRAIMDKSFSAEPSARADAVLATTRYIQGDAVSATDLAAVLAAANGRIAVYFALPPAVTILACTALSTIPLPSGIIFGLEKPFGRDLESAQALNRLLEITLPESQIFRVDHFLGKSTVLNLLGLRFANRIFEPLLSGPNVEKVEIRFDETLALEGRAGYYDKAGALVDMIQSHLLLVLALVTMEPPASVNAEDLRGAMAQALRATRPWAKGGGSSRRARYSAGTIAGKAIPAYVDEAGVNPELDTETLAEVTLAVENWRWAGVPFILRSGKALGEAKQEILITFREVPHLPVGLSGATGPATLRLSLKPAALELDVLINGEDDPFVLDRAALQTDLRNGHLSAYGEVLAGLLESDPTLSVRGDVAEECWRIVGSILDSWRKGEVELETYPAGSDGPGTD